MSDSNTSFNRIASSFWKIELYRSNHVGRRSLSGFFDLFLSNLRGGTEANHMGDGNIEGLARNWFRQVS